MISNEVVFLPSAVSGACEHFYRALRSETDENIIFGVLLGERDHRMDRWVITTSRALPSTTPREELVNAAQSILADLVQCLPDILVLGWYRFTITPDPVDIQVHRALEARMPWLNEPIHTPTAVLALFNPTAILNSLPMDQKQSSSVSSMNHDVPHFSLVRLDHENNTFIETRCTSEARPIEEVVMKHLLRTSMDSNVNSTNIRTAAEAAGYDLEGIHGIRTEVREQRVNYVTRPLNDMAHSLRLLAARLGDIQSVLEHRDSLDPTIITPFIRSTACIASELAAIGSSPALAARIQEAVVAANLTQIASNAQTTDVCLSAVKS